MKFATNLADLEPIIKLKWQWSSVLGSRRRESSESIKEGSDLHVVQRTIRGLDSSTSG